MKFLSKSVVLLGISLFVLGATSGCVEKERVITTTKTQSGKNRIKGESVQEYRRSDGTRSKEKQYFYERRECLAKDGRTLTVDSENECLRRGGKVVDVLITDEQSIGNK